MSVTFPSNWRTVLLGDELPIEYGKGLPKRVRDAAGKIPVVGSAGVVGRHTSSLTPGPVIVIGRKGNVGAVHYQQASCWPIDTTFYAVPSADQNAQFFRYLLEYLDLGSLDRSTAVPSLSRDDYNAVSVGIPPLVEQGQIVEAIEKHLSRMDAAASALLRAKANVKRARASVLQAAVEGRLVPTEAELAKAEDRDYEPASVLLERILAERKEAWAQSGARGKYKEPAAPNTDDLPPLPKGWTWATVEQVGMVVTGKTPSTKVEKYWLDEVPFVTPSELRGGYIKSSSRSVARVAEDVVPFVPRGSVLVCCIGATIGKIGVAATSVAFNQQINAILPVCRDASMWIHSALSSPHLQRSLWKQSSATTMPIVNKRSFSRIVIPLPPLAEQERIVAEVDRRLSVLDALDATLDANLARCAQLRQAILKRAFEGRFVPTSAPVGATQTAAAG